MQFDPRTHQYRDESGKFVNRTTVIRFVDLEQTKLETRLSGHARVLASGRIELPEFERRVANELKMSHIRMGLLGAGGREQMNPSQYGVIGRRLRDEYKLLKSFGDDIASGKMSINEIQNRVKRYGQSTRQSFFRAEQIARAKNGFTHAKRSLDPNARHCPECPAYSTRGQWIPIEQVIVPGHACSCRGRCRCSIAYKVESLSDAKILNRTIVGQEVALK